MLFSLKQHTKKGHVEERKNKMSSLDDLCPAYFGEQ